uniref:Pellino FHA domain-containing protein n=1 Tax=Wuchereria bancrofti TaxID=6293 RepID=A0AAF5PTI8_WUCBA
RIGLWFQSLNTSPPRLTRSTCNSAIFLNLSQNAEDYMGMFVWREVSVDGDIYNIRETRSSTKRGELLAGETNELQNLGQNAEDYMGMFVWKRGELLAGEINHFQSQIHNPL